MLHLRIFFFIVILNLIFVSASSTKTNQSKNVSRKSPQKLKNFVIDYDLLCKNSLCIAKCCPVGKYLFGLYRKCKKPSIKATNPFGEIPLYTSNLTISGKHLNNLTLVPGRLLDQAFYDTSFDQGFVRNPPNYYLTEDGTLFVERPNAYDRWQKFNTSQYCVDYTVAMPRFLINNITVRFVTTYTPEESDNEASSPYIGVGLLVSVIFLFLVLMVYALLPELRNLSGKVLMAYVFSLMNGFLLLYIMKYNRAHENVCKGLSFCTYFLFLASFCWMNIMSCDIWWTFRGYAKARPIHRRGENFKFGMYCIYAWGLPAALTVMLIVMSEMDLRDKPWIVKPNILATSCFIGRQETYYYLYIPMLILVTCNWVFFLMTAFNIWRLHRATAVLDSAAAGTPAAHRSHKYRFLVYLKLSVIMGINWVLEAMSSFYPESVVWYVPDIYNALTGLIIFLIFVCKAQTFRKLTKRFNGCNDWTRSRHWYTRTRQASSTTTESDVSTEVPVCVNPKGPDFFKINN